MEEQTTTTEAEGKDVQTGTEATPPTAEEPSAESLNAFQKFLNGLFGGKESKAADPEPGKAEEKAPDQKKETKAADPAGSEEKAFTQADLEAAVEAARQKWLDEAAEAERMKKLTPEQKAAEEQQKRMRRSQVSEAGFCRKSFRKRRCGLWRRKAFRQGLRA